MCSFIEDELGATEPYTSLPALGIVAIGIIIFSFLMMSAYSSYASSAYYAGIKADLRYAARLLASDQALSCSPGMLDAHKLDNASADRINLKGQAFQVTIEAAGYSWQFSQGSGGRPASYRLPAVIKLNDARCIPGTLTVTMREG